MFRSLDLRTPLGQKFVEYSSKGLLVPDDLTVELWRTKIEAQVLEAEFKPDIDALVLDGIPRNVNQAKLMENLIDVKRVFHLSCPKRDELVRRLRKRAIKDNRFDDASEEVIRKRLGHLRGRDQARTGFLLRPGDRYRCASTSGEGSPGYPWSDLEYTRRGNGV